MELTTLLERLRMDHPEAQLDGICEQAAKEDLDYKGFLAQALEAEWRGRYQRGVESRLKLARFPWIKTLRGQDPPGRRPRGQGRGGRLLGAVPHPGKPLRARQQNRLECTLQQLVYPRVLILDELDYLPLTREEASLFFRLLVRRDEGRAWWSRATRASETGRTSSTTRSWPP